MALIVRNFTQLQQDTSQRLVTLGFTDALYQGTPIWSLVAAADMHLSLTYQDMQANLSTQYLSTAVGAGLTNLVQIVGILPRAGETDAALRYRASQAMIQKDPTSSSAITTALMGISGVISVIPVPYTQGVGTITYYLIGSTGILTSSVVALAQQTAVSMLSAGAQVFIDTPDPLYVNLYLALALSSSQIQNVVPMRQQAVAAATSYVNGLSMGDTFILDGLTAAVLNSSSQYGSPLDVSIEGLSTTDSNGVTTEHLLTDIVPQFDQQVLPGTVLAQ